MFSSGIASFFPLGEVLGGTQLQMRWLLVVASFRQMGFNSQMFQIQAYKFFISDSS